MAFSRFVLLHHTAQKEIKQESYRSANCLNISYLIYPQALIALNEKPSRIPGFEKP
jgi:hypothetical protein